MSEAQPALTVDARGHRCPTPTLRLRRALEAVGAGAVVRVLADDPLARIDIPHFCAANGHKLLALTVTDGVAQASVRKGGLGLPGAAEGVDLGGGETPVR